MPCCQNDIPFEEFDDASSIIKMSSRLKAMIVSAVTKIYWTVIGAQDRSSPIIS